MDILRANDEVSRVMQSFEKIVQPKLAAVKDGNADGAPEPVNIETPKGIAMQCLDVKQAILNLIFTS